MLKITDKMVEELNSMMDSAIFTKDEFFVFDSHVNLAKHIYKNNFEMFLRELEDAKVHDEEISLIENFFYEYPNVIEEGSYGWIYLIK